MLRKLTAALISIAILLSVFCLPFSAHADEVSADNSALLEVLSRIENYEEADYTPESYAPLHTLYEQYAPIASEMDNQSEIDTAVFQLLEAVSSLKAYLKLTVSSNIDGALIDVSFDGNTYSNGEHTVVFGTTVTLRAPEIEGYFFGGWLETVSKRILSDSDTYTFKMSVNASLQAFYVNSYTAALIFVSYSGQIISIIEKTTEEWSQYDSINEFLPPVPYRFNHTNGRWYLCGNELELLQSGEFVTIDPEYDELNYGIPSGLNSDSNDAKLKMFYHYDSENNVGTFIMSTYIPENISFESVGMLFYYKKASLFNPESFDVNINNKMMVSQYDYLSEQTYITDMKKFTNKYNWAVRGYATYVENGELKTVYSNQVNVVNTEDIHELVESEGYPPTCTSYGYTRTLTCEICGRIFDEQESIPPLGHDYADTVTLPTCTTDGYITRVCARCGDTVTVRPEYNSATGEYTHPELLKTEHQYELSEITVPATLDTVGEAEYVCSVCGDTVTRPYYIAQGSCGDNVNYSFNHETGELTISGSGTMESYSVSSNSIFYNNTNITSVNIESGVTGIGECAFYGCSNIESITIPATVTSIGNRAFYNCTSLGEVNVPSSVTSIGYYAFYNCSALSSLNLNDGENPLTIAEYAFSNCTSLNNLVITSRVTQIGTAAFTRCSALDSVTIPNTVTSFGEEVFSYCTSLTQATVQSGVTVIESSTFRGCTSLYSVNLPDSIRIIGSNAFRDCSALTEITLPSQLYNIESYAFLGCSSLTGITIPQSVTQIGSFAFANCSLIDCVLPSNIQALGNSVFMNCTGITQVVIPSNLTSIPSELYSGCTSVTSVTIPDGITQIGANAFYGCSSLQSVHIPQNVSSIGSFAFRDCSALQSITVDASNSVYDSRNNCNAIIETSSNTLIAGCNATVIPSGITSIADYALSGCSGITSITLPETVTSIGKYAFNECTSLQSINIPNGITTIKEGTFNNCSSLGAITIGENITAIETKAFLGCRSISEIVIPDSVTSLGSNVFSGCSALSSVTLLCDISTIPAYAFNGCTSLTEIEIPNSIRTIGTRAFANCTQLNQIVLGENVTTISGYAFSNCTGMTDIYIYNIGCRITSNASTIPANATIHAYLSSTAKTYADNYGRSFISLSS